MDSERATWPGLIAATLFGSMVLFSASTARSQDSPDRAAVAMGVQDVGSAVSPSFVLALGPKYVAPGAGGVGSASGAAFVLSLGPNYVVPGAGGVAAAASGTFPLYLGVYSVGFGLSDPFSLDGSCSPVAASPTGVSADVDARNAGIGLAWHAIAGAAGYRIRRNSGTTITFVGVSGAGQHEYLDAHAEEGVQYSYAVAAVDNCGSAGPYSTSVSAPRLFYPVVFVHGICSGPDDWQTWAPVFEELGLHVQARADFRRPDENNHLSTGLANAAIEDNALYLDVLLKTLKYSKVNLVAHSMGGIVSRYYIERFPGGADRVNKLVMIGSPNHGAGWNKGLLKAGFTLWEGVQSRWGGDFLVCQITGPAADQLKGNSEFLRQLNYGRLHGVKDEQCPGDRGNSGDENIPAGVLSRYWTVVGTGTVTAICNATDYRAERTASCVAGGKDGDGFISAGSAKLDALDRFSPSHNLLDIDLTGQRFRHSSGRLPGVPCAKESYLASTLLARQVAHLLKGEPFEPVPTQSVLQLPAMATAVLQDSTVSVDLAYPSLLQAGGTVASCPVFVPSTEELAFFAVPSTPAATFSLISPQGTPISRADTSIAAGIRYLDDDLTALRAFVLQYPTPGTWQLVVDATGIADSVATNMVLQSRLVGDIAADLDTLTWNGAAALRLWATVGPALDAPDSLTANLLLPSGEVVTTGLFDDGLHGDVLAGDRTYAGLRSLTQAGQYSADVHLHPQQSTDRSAIASVVVPSSADLAVDSTLQVEPERPDSGSTATVTASVVNRGGETVAASVCLLQGTVTAVCTTLALPPMATQLVHLAWLVQAGDSASVTVRVSLAGEQLEGRYDNNIATRTVYVRTPTNDVAGGIPQRFAMGQPRPNPTATGFVVEFDLPEMARVSLDLFDVVGRRVHQLGRPELLSAGRYTRSLHQGGASLAPGVYYLKLVAGPRAAVRSIVLLR